MKPVRYAYGISSALLIGGAAFSLATGYPAGAQEAQNEPSKIQSVMPRGGAPMSFAGLVDQLQPAVVGIQTRQQVKVDNNQGNNPLFNFFFGGPGGPGGPQQQQQPRTQIAHALGSGFLVSADGYIVTNNHVITAEGQGTAQSITVKLFDGKEYKAKIVGQDDYSDIAVLKIDAGKPLPFVKFGNSGSARAGDWVLAIGNPFGLASTVTAGIVSSAHRHAGGGAYDEYIQTDASINPGNSGGPMFDMNGNVIGINRWIVSPNGGGNVGIGFAIPSDVAKPIVDNLISGKAIERGYLGAQLVPLEDEMADALGLPHNEGEYTQAVVPGDPADKAGLQRGDIVTAISGQKVTDDLSAATIMAQTKPGARVTLSVIRQGKPLTLTATVGSRPTDEELSKKDFGSFQQGGDNDNGGGADQGAYFEESIGLHVIDLTGRVAQQLGATPGTTGVVITDIEDGSGAADTPLGPGMIITSVNYKNVGSSAEFHAAVAAAQRQGRNAVLLHVIPQGSAPGDVAVRFDSGKKPS